MTAPGNSARSCSQTLSTGTTAPASGYKLMRRSVSWDDTSRRESEGIGRHLLKIRHRKNLFAVFRRPGGEGVLRIHEVLPNVRIIDHQHCRREWRVGLGLSIIISVTGRLPSNFSCVGGFRSEKETGWIRRVSFRKL